MQTRQLGDPLDWSTDIGPVIDISAQQQLLEHIESFRARGQLIFQTAAPSIGFFVPLTLIRLTQLDELSREAFGPILHIIRYADNNLDAVVDEINQTGFGLTCGLHSRNLQRAQTLARRLRVGNCYINRDMIGAVVGVQPFGGNGKSGTGPKAGGPHYLQRFVIEQTITINTAAIGGDAQLLSASPPRFQ
jgi:RHH-type proline utilization regulon transcriptional repressor/proline dehydrogenase/delta 1-pyrroline-5-carboxylate dehydrogenase